MQKQVAAVEPKDKKTVDLSAVEPGNPTPSGRPAVKFTYPGGSRPLEGYTIKRGVGHGGFGEIYFALSDAGKEVALKLIRRNLDVELRGIRHCLNLKHPNLLSLFDIRQDDDGDTWVVMEYVSDGCLADVLTSHPGGMPPERALAWFHGVAAGVAYLHDRGIVHRDLKPGNIFSDEGLVKVGDYGLSKFISCSRRSGQTESVGTVHYMAPEVANGRYGKEIDVYALGIILYEMLTGRVPFEGESVGEVLMKHLTAKPDVSPLAQPYRSVVARALEKDPAKRFKSVAEMQAALPSSAQAPPVAGRLPSESQGTAAAPAAAVAAAAGGSGAKSPFAEGVVTAQVADDEPILKAVRETWQRLCTAWNQANLAMPLKILILVAGMLVLLAGSKVLIPLAVFLLILYGMYRLIRVLAVSDGAPAGQTPRSGVSAMPPPPPAPQAPRQQTADRPRYGPAYARTAAVRHGRRGRWHPREQAAAALVVKPTEERLTELIGSLLVGALVAGAMCVVLVLLSSYRGTTPSPVQCAWLALTSIAGTWAVLSASKFWEGTRGEATLRRFILMVIGLGLGALAFGVAAMLMVELPYDAGFPRSPNLRLAPGFYDAAGPLAMAHMACFGTLFLLVRWWRQADPLRPSRLSLWSVIVSAAVAGFVAWAWSFPQPWLLMVAATMSISVQLASPWVHPHKRFRRQNV